MQRIDNLIVLVLRTLLISGLFVNLTVSGTAAQTLPTAGELGRQVLTSVNHNSTSLDAFPNLEQAVVEPPLIALPGGPTIIVSKIEIVGNRVILLDEIIPVISKAFGTSMTLADLEELALDVTRFYRTKGFFVARAYIPAQEVVNGVVIFRIIEGNYGDFILDNSSLVRDEITQSILDNVKVYDIVSLDTLERAMLIANDTPGVAVTKADVMPGEAVGTSDFAVETVATQRYYGSATLDSYGSIYTGKNRLSFVAGVNSPTGIGDQLSLSGMITETSDLSSLRLAYSSLLEPNGLRGEVSFSQTNYELGSVFANLNAVGTARSVDMGLSYPIKRTRNRSLDLSWGVSSRNLNDEIRSTGVSTPKNIMSTSAGLAFRDEGYLWGTFGLTQMSATMTFGALNIEDATAFAADAVGAQTQGHYGKLVVRASRAMKLPNDLSVILQLRMQQSLDNKNLDSSERMGVSGSGGVMAYPLGELSGSNARFGSIEIAGPLPKIEALSNLNHNWSAFAEWGRAGEADPINSSDNMRSISGIGLSWSGTWENVTAKVYLTHRLEAASPITEPSNRTSVAAEIGMLF